MTKEICASIAINSVALVSALIANYMAKSSVNGWGNSQFISWNIWITMPYIVNVTIFLISGVIFKKASKIISKSSIVVSIVILTFTLFSYSLVNSGSTGGLLFLFIPLYILVGGPAFLIAVGLILNKYYQAKTTKHNI